MGKTEDGKFARRLNDNEDLIGPCSSTNLSQSEKILNQSSLSATNINPSASKKAKPSFMKGVIIKKKSIT